MYANLLALIFYNILLNILSHRFVSAKKNIKQYKTHYDLLSLIIINLIFIPTSLKCKEAVVKD